MMAFTDVGLYWFMLSLSRTSQIYRSWRQGILGPRRLPMPRLRYPGCRKRRTKGTILMTSLLVLNIIYLALGVAAGVETMAIRTKWKAWKAKRVAQKALEARAADTRLTEVMESTLKTIEDCARQLNPPHETDCPCAYCEIAHGPWKISSLFVAELQKRWAATTTSGTLAE